MNLLLFAVTILNMALVIQALPTDMPIANSYIVVLKDCVKAKDHIFKLFNMMDSGDYKIEHVYQNSLEGYAGTFSPTAIAQIYNDPDVDHVERNFPYNLPDLRKVKFPENNNFALWNLARISNFKANPENYNYEYPKDGGVDVNIYIIDSGVDIFHPDFKDRITNGPNFINNEQPIDYNGHGTHVAGIAAGRLTGVSPLSHLTAVKVLDRNGAGTTSTILGGLNYVVNEQLANTSQKSVASLSLSGLQGSEAIKSLFLKGAEANIIFTVAAGNGKGQGTDSCASIPSSYSQLSPNIITVGATTNGNADANFSQDGKCVSIFAPGTNILSTMPSYLDPFGQNNLYKFDTGTSMAAPHVAGVVALFWSTQGWPAKALRQGLVLNGVKDQITDITGETPNIFVSTSNLL